MSREEEIEEIARDSKGGCAICRHCPIFAHCDAFKNASRLHKAGYRKQSEGAWMTHYFASNRKSTKGETILYKIYVCDVCEQHNGRRKTPYCPNCGAKMKGGE